MATPRPLRLLALERAEEHYDNLASLLLADRPLTRAPAIRPSRCARELMLLAELSYRASQAARSMEDAPRLTADIMPFLTRWQERKLREFARDHEIDLGPEAA